MKTLTITDAKKNLSLVKTSYFPQHFIKIIIFGFDVVEFLLDKSV